TVRDGTLRLAADELTGYFWSYRLGARGQIFYASRPDWFTPFSVTPVIGLNGTGNDLDPTLSSDGTLLVFRHNTPGDDLWMATRVSNTEFTSPMAILNLNSAESDAQPSFRPGGEELLFQSYRSGSGDLYRTTRVAATTFAAPTLITELVSTFDDGDPVLSTDGLTLYFRSSRPTTLAAQNIYVATRPTLGSPFDPPVLVPNVNSGGDDGPATVSPDGCRLYLSSDRAGTNDIYVARRGDGP
nr:PD40 domain-containing protein [Deltaproteobacteria bacterium]